MKKLLIIPLLFLSLILNSATYYVSTTGNDANAGMIGSPWATWQKAFIMAEAGDTVYFRGGTWTPTTAYSGNNIMVIYPRALWNDGGGFTHIGHNGTADNPIVYMAYPGETPIMDCTQITTAGSFNSALVIQVADYIKFKGLTIKMVKQKRDYVECFGIIATDCTNITFENITLEEVDGNALRWNGGYRAMNGASYYYPHHADIPTNNIYFINCDAFNCADSLPRNNGVGVKPGGAADGYKIIDYIQTNVYFNGCRAWNNSDDGFDPTPGGYLQMDNCWSYSNGSLQGDGTGFKTGGLETTDDGTLRRVLTNNLSVSNRGYGFFLLEYDGYGRSHAHIHNNFSYGDNIGFTVSRNTTFPNPLGEWRNNVSYKSVSLFDNKPLNWVSSYLTYTESNNTWNGTNGYPGFTEAYTINNSYFISLDSTQLTASRKEDGSLPDLTFSRISGDSPLIEAGTDVGMTATPDIGIDWVYYDLTYGAGEEEPPPAEEDVVATIYSNTATGIKSILATSGGNITSDGGATITERGIVWGTSANPTTSNSKIIVSGTTGAYSVEITGLLSNTTYHVRSYATNSVGTAYGADCLFTTTKYTLLKDTKIYKVGDLIIVVQ